MSDYSEVGRLIADAYAPLEAIFGAPVAPTPAQSVDTDTATVRMHLFREALHGPRKHTGEAETIAIWSDRAAERRRHRLSDRGHELHQLS